MWKWLVSAAKSFHWLIWGHGAIQREGVSRRRDLESRLPVDARDSVALFWPQLHVAVVVFSTTLWRYLCVLMQRAVSCSATRRLTGCWKVGLVAYAPDLFRSIGSALVAVWSLLRHSWQLYFLFTSSLKRPAYSSKWLSIIFKLCFSCSSHTQCTMLFWEALQVLQLGISRYKFRLKVSFSPTCNWEKKTC